MENLELIFKSITLESKFNDEVKVSIDKILKDGKIDYFDIPEILLIINKIPIKNYKLDTADYKTLIQKLFDYIIEKFELIPQDADQEVKDSFKKIVDSCITLLLIKPKIINNKCIPCFK
jgi:predicted secreted protein